MVVIKYAFRSLLAHKTLIFFCWRQKAYTLRIYVIQFVWPSVNLNHIILAFCNSKKITNIKRRLNNFITMLGNIILVQKCSADQNKSAKNK